MSDKSYWQQQCRDKDKEIERLRAALTLGPQVVELKPSAQKDKEDN